MSCSILKSQMSMFSYLFDQINSSFAFSLIKGLMSFRLSYQFDYFVDYLFKLFDLIMINQLVSIGSLFDWQAMFSLTKMMHLLLNLEMYLYFAAAQIDFNCYYLSDCLIASCCCSFDFTIENYYWLDFTILHCYFMFDFVIKYCYQLFNFIVIHCYLLFDFIIMCQCWLSSFIIVHCCWLFDSIIKRCCLMFDSIIKR